MCCASVASSYLLCASVLHTKADRCNARYCTSHHCYTSPTTSLLYLTHHLPGALTSSAPPSLTHYPHILRLNLPAPAATRTRPRAPPPRTPSLPPLLLLARAHLLSNPMPCMRHTLCSPPPVNNHTCRFERLFPSHDPQHAHTYMCANIRMRMCACMFVSCAGCMAAPMPYCIHTPPRSINNNYRINTLQNCHVPQPTCFESGHALNGRRLWCVRVPS